MKLFAQLSLFGNKFVLISFVLLISSWWLYRKDYRAAITLFSSFLTALIAVGIMKIIFHHPRPSGLIVASHSPSFPSGHVSLATTCYFLLAHLLTEKQPYTMQQWAKGLTITLISLVALSRLFLGMHWLCDVLAGFCLGIAITSATQMGKKQSPLARKRGTIF
jgi:membrane-associated phospholipid phosphatase